MLRYPIYGRARLRGRPRLQLEEEEPQAVAMARRRGVIRNQRCAQSEGRLQSAPGVVVEGEAEFTPTQNGVRATVQIENATPGMHGIHVHEKGDCSDIPGKSMGSHFAPDAKGTACRTRRRTISATSATSGRCRRQGPARDRADDRDARRRPALLRRQGARHPRKGRHRHQKQPSGETGRADCVRDHPARVSCAAATPLTQLSTIGVGPYVNTGGLMAQRRSESKAGPLRRRRPRPHRAGRRAAGVRARAAQLGATRARLGRRRRSCRELGAAATASSTSLGYDRVRGPARERRESTPSTSRCRTPCTASSRERARAAGIHVLCEKPLASTRERLPGDDRSGRGSTTSSLMTAYRLHFEPANLEAVEARRARARSASRASSTSIFTMQVKRGQHPARRRARRRPAATTSASTASTPRATCFRERADRGDRRRSDQRATRASPRSTR